MNIVVTGGCGFIGSSFVNYLYENVNCDISNLNNGVYLISAELNNGQIINQKFVK